MIDIALVGPSFPYRGGIAHFNSRLTQALAARARVLPIDWSPHSGEWIRGPWVEPGSQSSPLDGRLELAFGDPRSWRRASSRLRSDRPRRLLMHWVQPWCAPAYLTLIRAARQTGGSVELIVHNAIPHEKRRIGALMTRLVVGRADRAMAHSEWDARVLRRWCPGVRVDAAFHPIYDQFRSDRINAPLTERLGKLGRPVLLFFGFIRPYKGLDLAIRAMPRILDAWPRATLLIAGESPKARWLKRHAMGAVSQVAALGLGQHVQWEDRYIPSDEVAGYFKAADLVLLPYRSASQSGVLQIAYGLERPVVATRVGGLPEMIEDGVSGRLADPEDPGSLADAILRCLEAPPDPEQIRKYAARFSWDRYVEILLQEPAP